MATLGYDGFPVVSFCGHARLRGGGEEAARAEVFWEGAKKRLRGLRQLGRTRGPWFPHRENKPTAAFGEVSPDGMRLLAEHAWLNFNVAQLP